MHAKLKFFPAQSGQDSARLEFSSGRQVHLHSALSPEREWEQLQEVPIWADTVVILGVGLGYQLDKVDFGPAKRVVLVDTYEALLCRAAQRLSKRINKITCLKTSEVQRLIRALSSVPNDSLQILRHPASWKAFPEVYEGIERTLLAQRTTGSSSRSNRRVLLLRGQFFLEQEAEAALQDAGLENLSVLHYREHEEGSPREAEFQALIERERPELILSMSFKGFDRQGRMLRIAQRYGIPIAVWFLDDPRPNVLAFEADMGPNVHAFTWEEAYVPWLSKRKFESVRVLPLGASDQVFSKKGQSPPEIPLSFVGSSIGPRFLGAIKDRFLWDPSLQPLVNSEAIALLNGEIDALSADRGKLPFDDEKNRAWFSSTVVHTASHIKRIAVCRALLPEGLETFGDPETWRTVLGPSAVCHEPVDYYRGLADIYRRSSINLNITSCQMPTTVNQRLFDVPLAGGFLLTDPQAVATQLFEEGREVAVYHSIEEAIDLVRFFKNRPDLRAKISEAARKRILGEHLMTHRIQHILSSVLGEQASSSLKAPLQSTPSPSG